MDESFGVEQLRFAQHRRCHTLARRALGQWAARHLCTFGEFTVDPWECLGHWHPAPGESQLDSGRYRRRHRLPSAVGHRARRAHELIRCYGSGRQRHRAYLEHSFGHYEQGPDDQRRHADNFRGSRADGRCECPRAGCRLNFRWQLHGDCDSDDDHVQLRQNWIECHVEGIHGLGSTQQRSCFWSHLLLPGDRDLHRSRTVMHHPLPLGCQRRGLCSDSLHHHVELRLHGCASVVHRSFWRYLADYRRPGR